MTTDTTDAVEKGFKRETLDSRLAEEVDKPAVSQGLEEDEGIQSSDEETPTYKKKPKESMAAPKTHIENVSTFKDEHAEPLFQNNKVRDQTENQFNYGDEDIEFFSEKL